MESDKPNNRPQPGVWRNKITGALYELRYSSAGVPLFVAYDGFTGPSSVKDYELIEADDTLVSPLFRAPGGDKRQHPQAENEESKAEADSRVLASSLHCP